jgi:hypothetical protein
MTRTRCARGPLLNRRLLALVAIAMTVCAAPVTTQGGAARRINAPYFSGAARYAEAAIAWFGRVEPQRNYTDIRVAYTDTEIWISLQIFDQWLWEDDAASRTPASLEQWDAATILINKSGPAGTPTSSTYRFVAELSWWRPRTDYQAAYVGNGTGWTLSPGFAFTTEAGWRGDGVNNAGADRGWAMTYHIPYASLGLAGPPAAGAVWGLGIIVHDKDSSGVPAVVDSFWPETLVRDQPATWGQLAFGLRSYPTIAIPPTAQTYTIRHLLNGTIATDAMVGGGAVCGGDNRFDTWGSLNYAGSTTLVVQNQSDTADWPCFSKIYFDFPLTALPAGRGVVSATLTVYQFGGSQPSAAQPSLIQVLTAAEPWTEAGITWNNAPLAVENVGQSWVDPLLTQPPWPGAGRTWNVSWAVNQAYQNRQNSLRLVLYSADSAYHSGKYFTSAETGDWNAVGRPTLQVILSDTASPPIAPTNLRIVP